MKQSKSTDNSYTFIQSIHTGYNYEYGHLSIILDFRKESNWPQK